jgi:hypothetical protein
MAESTLFLCYCLNNYIKLFYTFVNTQVYNYMHGVN